MPDAALAAACCRGESEAEHRLWAMHKNRMYGVCLRFAASKQEAQDILQEGFLRVFGSVCKFRGEGSLEGWVRKIMVRTALEHLQKRQAMPHLLDLDALENLLPDPQNLDDLDDPISAGKLVELLQKLPPGFRAVLNLYILEEQSHEQIARELGISIGTSKSQLHRAKIFFKKLLDKTLLLVF